jgi:hypothetical protein
MFKNWWQILCVASALLTIPVTGCKLTQAEEIDSNDADDILTQINGYNQTSDSMAQVTNVSQLRDVSPGDWAYEALRSLVERYGCIVGYPDLTYRGNRALSRYEFAAGLNACMQQMERLIAQSEAVLREDLEKLKRLMKEFEVELAYLGARVDNLEGRVAFLEDRQFSTTTQLRGEVSIAVSSVFGDKKADGSGEKLEDNPVLDFRSHLYFDTTFNGDDLLQVRLDALNSIPFGPGEDGSPNVTGTNMTRLNLDEGTGSSVRVGKLFYRFALGNGLESDGDNGLENYEEDDDEYDPRGATFSFIIDAVGGEFNENFVNFNEYFEEEFTGAISRFGRYNPIYAQAEEGSGASINYQFSELVGLSLGYLAGDASNPEPGKGLFNGLYGALGQLTFSPSDNFDLGLTYARAYYPEDEVAVSAETGTESANAPFGEEIPTTADHLGLQFSYQITPTINVSAWGGLSFARAEGSGFNEEADFFVDRGSKATIYNWAVTLAVLDLGSEGSLLGFIFGQPPKASFNSGGDEDSDSAWHLETQYRYQINDNIAINPGFFVVLNPENNSANNAIWVGTIRSIFEF